MRMGRKRRAKQKVPSAEKSCGLHLRKAPSEELLLKLIGKHIYSKWNTFGVYLGVAHNVRQGIQQQKLGDSEECFVLLCAKWLAGESGTGDKPRTWGTVLDAVRNCDYPDVANEAEKSITVSETELALHCLIKYQERLLELPLHKKRSLLNNHFLLTDKTLEKIDSARWRICGRLSRADINYMIFVDVVNNIHKDFAQFDIFCKFLQLEFGDLAKHVLKQINDEFIVAAVHIIRDDPSTVQKGYSEKLPSWKNTAWVITLISIVLVVGFGILFNGSSVSIVIPKLPNVPAAFTGRELEIEAILEHFLHGNVRVVAITGGPGYGKSSLAIVCAHNMTAVHSKQAYHVSLTETDTLSQLVMNILVSFNVMHDEEQSARDELFLHISTLKEECILILDNADHFTLRDTDIRAVFLKVIKEMTSKSPFLSILVTTRYRFNMVDEFVEIHLQPLNIKSAIDLLKTLTLPSCLFSTEEEQMFPTIANLTGGIPLAVKVISQLLKSRTLSVTQVISGLSSQPLHILSRETFSPEEQLNRCFNLSYTYLNPVSKQCFVYAARFPGTFDLEAGRAIVGYLTNNSDCLDQLIERSLIEFDAHSERYDMHSLLRHFAKESVSDQFGEEKFFTERYVNYYVRFLYTLIKNANSGSDDHINRLYSRVSIDYYHFLHSFKLLGQSKRPLVGPRFQLQFVLNSFDLVKPRFPWDTLITMWERTVIHACIPDSNVDLSLDSSDSMAPDFITFVIKLGSLFQIEVKNVNYTQDLYEIAIDCVGGKTPTDSSQSVLKSACSTKHRSYFIQLLQSLKNIYEESSQLQSVHDIEKAIKKCIEIPKRNHFKALDRLSDCQEHLEILQDLIYKHCLRRDGILYSRLVNVFSTHQAMCHEFGTDHLMEELKYFESLFVRHLSRHDQHKQGHTMVLLSKLWSTLSNSSREVHWLNQGAVMLVEVVSMEYRLFQIHFRLTRLYFTEFNDMSKAIDHAKLSYKYAKIVQLNDSETNHECVFQAAFRLADVLYENKEIEEASAYYQEAMDLLPFIWNRFGTTITAVYQRNIELHLMHIFCVLKQFDKIAVHYGQWSTIELSTSAHSLKMLVQDAYKMPFFGKSYRQDVTVVDDSILPFKWLDFASVKVMKMFDIDDPTLTEFANYIYVIAVTMLLCHIFLIILFLLSINAFISCSVTACTAPCLLPEIFIFNQIARVHFFFHYFLYYAIVKGKIWQPAEIPQIPKFIWIFYEVIPGIAVLCSILLLFVLLFVSIIAIATSSHYVLSDDFHCLSMTIVDYVLF